MVIVDDHELFSTALMIALRGRGLEARRIPVANAQEFAAQPSQAPVGLVVLDLHLGTDARGSHLMGYDLVPGLRDKGWKSLIVSGNDDEAGIATAIARGAVGSVPKTSAFDLLLRTVLAAAAGEPVLTEAEHRRWLERYRVHEQRGRDVAQRLARLTARERQVLELLAEGYRAAAIAGILVVSITTVRAQMRSIYAKLEVNSQLEAVALIRQAST